MKKTLWLVPCLVLCLACGSSRRDDPILRLSAQEALEQGRTLMAEGKYREARKYLIHAFEIEPNSASGREGLLLAADALFQQGGYESYVEAERRYRDFINRFPTSERTDHAQFRLAMSLANRMEKPNREQETTRKALAAVDDMLRSYPTSPYFQDAVALRQRIRDRLAEHEWLVAYFYSRYGLPGATVSRLEYLLENYPGYQEREKVLELLCSTYVRYLPREGVARLESAAKASEWCRALVEEYPQNSFAPKVPADVLEAPLVPSTSEDASR